MFVHHSGKNSYKGMRGSSYLLGTVDTAIQVDNIDNTLMVQIEKQKDGIEGSFQLKFKQHLDSLVVYNGDINLRFKTQKVFILNVELKENDINQILEMLKQNKNFEDISKKFGVDVTTVKKFFKKHLIKKDETNINQIIEKYSIKNEKVISWIKENFKILDASETV
jgi:predicted transcriptional regulator